jgi:ribosome-associated toxin RatA of RatAB toxin-antitoxin module
VSKQVAVLVLVACLLASRVGAAEQSEPTQQWRLASQSGGLKLYSRVRIGSALKEFKAVGIIDASTRVVHNVLNDVAGYPKFMPFVAECRLLKREDDSIYAYQRISPKMVADRDYTIRVQEKSWPKEGGEVYSKRWQTANEVGPPEKQGVLRVKVCEGTWLLEPEQSERTRATYTIYTDTGGSLPAFIANAASGVGIRKIFAAIRHQAKDPKYRSHRDFLEPASAPDHLLRVEPDQFARFAWTGSGWRCSGSLGEAHD